MDKLYWITSISDDLKYWHEQTNIWLYRSNTEKKINSIITVRDICEKTVERHKDSNNSNVLSIVEIEKEKIVILNDMLGILWEA
jgi:hypothetical protein